LRNAHRIALKGESLRKQRLPDESAHPRADLDECLAAHCNALRVRQAKLARSSRWKTGPGKG